MVNQGPATPAPGQAFILQPPGSDKEARAWADKEFTRIAEKLKSPPPDPPRTRDVFTVPYKVTDDEWDADALAGRRDVRFHRMHFPWSDPVALARTMQAEVDDLYISGGTKAIDQLPENIVLCESIRRREGTEVRAPWRNIVPFTSSAQEDLATRTTLVACEKAVEDVKARAAKSLPATQKAAATLAVEGLQQAAVEIFNEADRYLDVLPDGTGEGLPARRWAQKLDILRADVRLGTGFVRTNRLMTPPGPMPPEVVGPVAGTLALKGRDVDGLLKALRGIQQHRSALTQAGGIAQKSLRDVSDVATLAGDHAQLYEVEARKYPILHKLWNIPDLPDTIRSIRTRDGEWMATSVRAGTQPGQRSDQDVEGYVALIELTNAIWTALSAGWKDNDAFTEMLRQEPEHVWRYRPLIGRALLQLNIIDPSINYRAAVERLEQEGGMSTPGQVQIGVGAMQFAAWLLAAPTSPVGWVLAAIAASVGLWATVDDYLQQREKEAAYKAVLSPGWAIDAEPGYAGVILDIAFNVLDIHGVKEALAAWRLARRAAPAASTAGKLVKP